jgi:dTDP-4-dehydrorhamnose reductase
VLGTTRRREAVDSSTVYLDLSERGAKREWPQPVSVAILCAGVTSLEECKREPAATARVNVDAIPALAEELVAAGIVVVYLSTNQVFDGTEAYRSPNDPTSPVTEYGRQKAEAERKIGRLGASVSIVRLTKVLYPATPLLSQWRDALEAGEAIQPFSDMYMAPVPLDHVVTVLRTIGERRLPGLLQVSGDRDVSYAEAALMGARALGADESLVRPVRTLDTNVLSEQPPRHTTLNTDRLESTLGLAPPDVLKTIEMAFGRISI